MKDQNAPTEDAVTTQAIKSILNEYVGAGPSAHPQQDTPKADELERTVKDIVAADNTAKTATPKKRRALNMPNLVAHVRRLNITRKQIMLVGLLALILLRPTWVVLALFAAAFLCLGLFLAFGADRIWESATHALNRYEARRPENAKRLRARLDRIAMVWDGILDRMPEGLVDGLYLPDFSGRPHQDSAHDSVVADRLSRMHEQV